MKLNAAVVLTRAPLLTPRLHPFEEAFKAYNHELQSRLAGEFPIDFYFKKGSVGEQKWLEEGYIAPTLAPRKEWIEDEQIQSIDRFPDRSLYLLLGGNANTATEQQQQQQDGWRFPQGQVDDSENKGLEDVVEKVLPNLEVWNVSPWPIAFYKHFYIKSYIMSGHMPKQQEHGWFTREEAQKRLDAKLWQKLDPFLT